jgi:transcriptional regulator with XRE-family HTH domain
MPPARTKPTFGEAIRRMRDARGLRQREVAEAADVAPETLSRIERGRVRPSLELLERIAVALEVDVSELRKGSEPRPNKLRPVDAQLVALVRDLSEQQVRDVIRSVRTLLEIGSTAHRPRRRSTQ